MDLWQKEVAQKLIPLLRPLREASLSVANTFGVRITPGPSARTSGVIAAWQAPSRFLSHTDAWGIFTVAKLEASAHHVIGRGPRSRLTGAGVISRY